MATDEGSSPKLALSECESLLFFKNMLFLRFKEIVALKNQARAFKIL